MDEIISNNWDLILEYSKGGCWGKRCSRCPFQDRGSSECLICFNKPFFVDVLTIEAKVQHYCKDIVEQRLYEILECK